MKFYELLKKYSNEQIIESLKKHYDKIVDSYYIMALNELRSIKPSEFVQNLEICVELVKNENDEDDNEYYLYCDGIGPDEEGRIIKWGLEYDDWENWLADEIHKDTLEKLDELTILAGILWEITYNGFTQKDVEDSREELQRRVDSIDRNYNN